MVKLGAGVVEPDESDEPDDADVPELPPLEEVPAAVPPPPQPAKSNALADSAISAFTPNKRTMVTAWTSDARAGSVSMGSPEKLKARPGLPAFLLITSILASAGAPRAIPLVHGNSAFREVEERSKEVDLPTWRGPPRRGA